MDKSEEMIRKTNILIEKVSYDRAVKDQCEFIYLGAIIARSSPWGDHWTAQIVKGE